MKFDYVISAMTHLNIFSPKFLDVDEYRKFAIDISEFTTDKVKDHGSTQHNISGMFNAYTEPKHVESLYRINDLKLNSIFSDSGGLQVALKGVPIDDELKDKIYKYQCYSDYAMSFDAIAIENAATGSQSRVDLAKKRFIVEKSKECGRISGQNIKRQCEIYRSIKRKVKTKIVIIVQGNTADEMVEYYNEIANILDEDDYQFIGGLSVAWASMGTGPFETLEMIQAAGRIAKICHPSMLEVLHFLGIGSINRIKPVVYLVKSGFLSDFKKITYDSSTHAGSMIFGRIFKDGMDERFDSTHKNTKLENLFLNMYLFYEDLLKPLITYDQFINIIFPDETTNSMGLKTTKSYTHKKILDNIPNLNEAETLVAVNFSMLYVFHAVMEFTKGIELLWNTSDNEELFYQHILNIKNNDDMFEFVYDQKKLFKDNKKNPKSRRIIRSDEKSFRASVLS